MAQEWPLDPSVHRRLTGGRHGYPKFEYEGRYPGDNGTDVYHASYPDPEDPEASRYGFTIRHRPGVDRPFSYNASQSEVDPHTGEQHISRFLDISNMGDQVLTFSQLGSVIERHHNMLRSLGLLKPRPPTPRPAWHFTAGLSKKADEFDDIVGGNGAAGPCWSCGKATYNYPEGRSLQSDQSSPVNAHEETGGEMHGSDINLCGDCATNDMNYHMAVTHGSRGPGKVWHYNDQGVSGCPECEAHLMDQADDDLQP